MSLIKIQEWLTENKLKIVIAGAGYLLAWIFAFYTKNDEMAKGLMYASVGFLFGVSASKI